MTLIDSHLIKQVCCCWSIDLHSHWLRHRHGGEKIIIISNKLFFNMGKNYPFIKQNKIIIMVGKKSLSCQKYCGLIKQTHHHGGKKSLSCQPKLSLYQTKSLSWWEKIIITSNKIIFVLGKQ